MFTETDISVADDPELLDLLADSGCKQVLIGLESPEPRALDGMDPVNWKQRQQGRYLDAIESIQSRGIAVNGCFILGLGSHTPETFFRLREFVERSGLLEVQVTVQTPFPGTPLYARLKREGRLVRDRFWDQCTMFDVNYHPRNMSIEELEEGLRWLFRELYGQGPVNQRKRHYMEIHKRRRANAA